MTTSGTLAERHCEETALHGFTCAVCGGRQHPEDHMRDVFHDSRADLIKATVGPDVCISCADDEAYWAQYEPDSGEDDDPLGRRLDERRQTELGDWLMEGVE